MKNFYLIIDFDSTFVQIEALERLADISLKGVKNKARILSTIAKITNQGMSGKIPFDQSIGRRLKLFAPKRENIRELIGILKEKITKSILINKDFFRLNHERIYVISGGFFDYIWPVIKEFGIKKSHVLANRFVENGNGLTYDKKSLLAQEKGKVKQIKELNLKGQVFVVGDGYTDWEIKKLGVADKFFAFTENIDRPVVVEKADYIVNNFQDFLLIFNRL
ncbi:HAD-IB family phosphatase [Candidatus Roizmanbacteria bacterium]|nr:HAD-IB family phosphatase [Candidatus Roizmanbacteria bacterium]